MHLCPAVPKKDRAGQGLHDYIGGRKMKDKNLRILICGGGMMGKSIAFVMTALPYLDVTVYHYRDIDLKSGIWESVKALAEYGVLPEDEIRRRIDRVKLVTDLNDEGVKNADIVIEAIPENLEKKQAFFAELEKVCRTDAIFCTNTSVIPPSHISAGLEHRERFAGTHFWNPGHLIPLVEVVMTDRTEQSVADTLMEMLKAAGKHPVLCRKDVPGFLANRLQHALWREAVSMVEHGIATPEAVDEAIKYSFGLRLPRLGPMENADMVGTDLTYNIHQYILYDLEDSHEPSPVLKKLVDEGKLGFKSGEGFKKWTAEEIEKSKDDLSRHLIRMLYNK